MKCKTFIMILYWVCSSFEALMGSFISLCELFGLRTYDEFLLCVWTLLEINSLVHHVFTPYSANFHQLPYLYMWYWVLDVFIISWIFLLSYRKTMKVKTCRSIFEFINMMNITILCIRTIRGLYVDLDRLCGNG